MEEARRNVIYLSFQEVVEKNRIIILESGGFVDGAGISVNLNSLKYVIDVVKSKLEEKEICPSLAQKAALYAFHIITRHIFLDGNKRTGMSCALYFLRLNGCYISDSINDNDIVELALKIANNEIDYPNVVEWFQKAIK